MLCGSTTLCPGPPMHGSQPCVLSTVGFVPGQVLVTVTADARATQSPACLDSPALHHAAVAHKPRSPVPVLKTLPSHHLSGKASYQFSLPAAKHTRPGSASLDVYKTRYPLPESRVMPLPQTSSECLMSWNHAGILRRMLPPVAGPLILINRRVEGW